MTSPPPLTIGAVRVSTDQQTDRYGPDRQREDVLREAERAGLIITEWVEESISGTDHDRAAENRYYTLARQHRGLNIIFSHPNRVGRHVEVTVGIARTIHQLGGTVWIAGMGSLRDRRNWKNFLRDAAEAENDHTDIVERLQRGKYDKAAHNRWPHGQPPYGYRIVRDERGKSVTLEPNEHAETVRTIFRKAAEGQSAISITTDLVKAGIPATRPGRSTTGLFTLRQVLYILRNSAYTGRRAFTGLHGETAVVTFPPLVTPAEFAAAQAHVDTRTKHQPRRTRHPALFAGHTRCTECGGTLAVFSNRNTSRKTGAVSEYVYYRCRSASSPTTHAVIQGGRSCTHRKLHPMALTDEQGWTLFTQAMTDPAFLAAAVARSAPDRPDHTARIGEIKAQMAQAVQRAVTHHLPEDVLATAVAPLRDELARLERDMSVIPIGTTPDMTDLAEAMAAHLPTLTTLEQRREALGVWKARLHINAEGPQRVEITVQHR